MSSRFSWVVLGMVLVVAGILVVNGHDTSVAEQRTGALAPAIFEEIQDQPEASPHAAVVASLRQRKVPAYELPTTESPIIETLNIDGDAEVHVLATETYRDLQANWKTLSRDGQWLEVYLPIRPNGITGWIELQEVDLYQNRYRIRVSRSEFMLEVFDDNKLILETKIAVGTGDTPTPVGTFYTTELLKTPDPEGPYGPFAFVLSGYSEHLLNYRGGPGIIGIHGTNDKSSLGHEVSHGCIRVDNEIIVELATFIPLATPIEII